MDYSLLTKARKALQPLWETASARGSTCWGPKREDNSYSGTNLILVVRNEAVFVSQSGNQLLIHEFSETKNTNLARIVRTILKRAGLMSKEDEVLPISDYTWFCEVCKKRGGIDYEDGDDRQLAVKKIYEAHTEASPGCDPGNVKIIDRNMVLQKELMQLVSFEKVK